jgi:glycosyltransferase involved in cell wall biosynthesis
VIIGATRGTGDLVAAPPVLEQTVDVALPVHNEERTLLANVRSLHSCLSTLTPLRFRITIVENGSTDRTWALAQQLSSELPEVQAIRLEAAGKGRAVREAWAGSDADVVAYMDVDLSTGLNAFLPLIAPLLTGHSDLAAGCRLAHGAQVRRGVKREILSRGYNILVRTALRVRFRDGQCGFKAGRRATVQALLPLVADDTWFFDTELLVRAERAGLRIHEIPVDWIDDLDTRVRIKHVVSTDLRGIWRLLRSPMGRSGAVLGLGPGVGAGDDPGAVLGGLGDDPDPDTTDTRVPRQVDPDEVGAPR